MTDPTRRPVTLAAGVVALAVTMLATAGCTYESSDSLAAGDASTTTQPAADDRGVTAPTTIEPSTSTTTTEAPDPLSTESRVHIRGIGDIVVGLATSDAAEIAGFPFVSREPITDASCWWAVADGGPSGLSFMIRDGEIARVDITSADIVTLSGGGVGLTTERVRALFPGRLEERPHPTVAGALLLVFVPTSAADAGFRVVFETDSAGRVTAYRAGRLPEVEWSDGCASA
ncbi:MAG TPA: hypothetical protein VGA13_00030 [Acidimicrobiales bacterium]